MRGQILQFLRERQNSYVSGEELSQMLSVSRTAIWKQIQALKTDGYDIEAHPRRGYALRHIPDKLLPAEIQTGLHTAVLGKMIHYYHEVESTNNEAKRAAAGGVPEGCIVVAESQSGGRGRVARGWFSPAEKGIWLSVVLRPPFLPHHAPKCTLMAAVAVTRAIRQVANLSCGIKWPNDILLNGKKLVGILTEMSAEMDAINYVVIGLGINVNIAHDDFPEELRSSATSLLVAGGQPVKRADLVCAVLQEMETLYDHTIHNGFAAILNEWRELSVTLGQVVNVVAPDEQYTGTAVDIDDEGALLVNTPAGLRRVIAGDVSIRRQS